MRDPVTLLAVALVRRAGWGRVVALAAVAAVLLALAVGAVALTHHLADLAVKDGCEEALPIQRDACIDANRADAARIGALGLSVALGIGYLGLLALAALVPLASAARARRGRHALARDRLHRAEDLYARGALPHALYERVRGMLRLHLADAAEAPVLSEARRLAATVLVVGGALAALVGVPVVLLLGRATVSYGVQFGNVSWILPVYGALVALGLVQTARARRRLAASEGEDEALWQEALAAAHARATAGEAAAPAPAR